MTASHHHAVAIPRGVLWGAGALLLASMALALGARTQRLQEQAPPPPARQVVEVRFEDRPDGTIAMLDAAGRQVSVVPAGGNGFVRGVLRGMFRTRKAEALGKDGVFRLSRQADGRLQLEDPQTGRRVDLDAFGPTNAAAFAELLTAGLSSASSR